MKFSQFFLIFVSLSIQAFSQNAHSKISSSLLQAMNSSPQTFDIVLSLTKGVDTFYKKFDTDSQSSNINTMSRGDKISHFHSQLVSYSNKSQTQLMNFLREKSAQRKLGNTFSITQLWISNEIFIDGADNQLIQELGLHPDIYEIREQLTLYIDPVEVISASEEVSAKQSGTPPWGIAMINATHFWNQNFNGTGVVVGHIDTGVRFTHTTLVNNLLPNYGWYDPVNLTRIPFDSDTEAGHGTHTLATAVGKDGYGVAPGAQWISCLGCPYNKCPELSLKLCGEFIMCPSYTDGTSKDCSKAPHIVTNSWATSGGSSFYDGIIRAWHTASIIPIFAAGNSGPTCGSLGSPGDHKDVISVGATTETDSIASFSSVGPSSRYETGVYKPDISAPGNNIQSALATGDNAFGSLSGTSMATPHVAGAAALYLSKYPYSSFDQVHKALLEGAERGGLGGNGQTCGGVGSDAWPNHVFGHGRLDMTAVKSASDMHQVSAVLIVCTVMSSLITICLQ